ncbi:hypothetical protein CYMTET_34416 [Cymbomonas tetramitiformis]|uniref:Uncharacterized protein n=1 Tax=Cymbomonas tetramitiformis TaxID=36881 RepID=A0AAE0FB98_9CHLO|nr:hypothetical protein CYMTET_34416 [Cymbomonas tetramitiformis]
MARLRASRDGEASASEPSLNGSTAHESGRGGLCWRAVTPWLDCARVWTGMPLLANRHAMARLRASQDGDASAREPSLDGTTAHESGRGGLCGRAVTQWYNCAPGLDGDALLSSRHRWHNCARVGTGMPLLDKPPKSGICVIKAELEAAQTHQNPTRIGLDADAAEGLRVSRGANINWLQGPPKPLDHGASLLDQTELETEAQRHVDNDA